MRIVKVLVLFVWFGFGFGVSAQQVHEELQGIVEAEVLEVVSIDERPIIGTNATATVQTLTARIESGPQDGQIVEFDNDLVILEPGDQIFLNHLITINGDEYYVFKDVDRRSLLIYLGLVFVGLLVWFAGRQGVRALASLALSIAAIIFVLVPALLAGYDPILTSLGVAGVILALVLFGTHGFNPRSYTAFFGTFLAVMVTCGIAAVFVSAMRLTGFGSDASVYLNFSTGGSLDFAGLLLGSIIIGILGVLDDVSITQASVVQELRAANQSLSIYELYQRAIRVGRDHVGSLVNTLALAYVGVALPLVLLFARTDAPIDQILNQEVVAAELVRIIVGSIGLILAVPLTTLIASWWFGTHGVDEKALSSHSHSHHH